MQKKNVVIGISAVGSGGKSTTTKKLVTMLGDAVSIHFDDYVLGDEAYPQDIDSWIEHGTDPNEVNVPAQLAQDLHDLSHGQSITSAFDGSTVHPARYIIFEAPFGREHHATGKYIDFHVFIDTPLEIALARRTLIHNPFEGRENATKEELLEQIQFVNFLLEGYTRYTRRIYLQMNKRVIPTSDFVLDGDQTVEAIAEQIITAATKANIIQAETQK
ncbi:MAG: hypothetical protein AAF639_00100 [Chloroflexota bacterium]